MLFEAAIVLALKDFRRGPGHSWRQQRDYASAAAFLDQFGLLQYVRTRDAEAEVVIDEVI